MNYTSLFYWLTVAENAKTMFVAFIWLFSIIATISTFAYFFKGEAGDSQEIPRKWMWWSYPFMVLFWSLFIFTPSKKDALLIVAGGQTLNFLTTDSTSRQIPHELTSFIVTELKNMAENAKVDLNIASQKDRILQEAKNMSADQLMERMRLDSNFARVILDK